MKYCDIDTDKSFEFGFSRIANTKTYNKRGIIAKSYGICIDLYPIVSIPKSIKERDIFFQKAQVLYELRLWYLKWNQRAVRVLPIKVIPGLHRAVKAYRDYLLDIDIYGTTEEFYIVAGSLNLRDKMSYNFDMFADIINVEFEGRKFCSIANYDRFLTLRYGDYMQLPPEDQRHPYHGGHYFWRKDK